MSAHRVLVHEGDEILVASPGHSSTSPDRHGRVVAVFGPADHEHYLVRWPDGTESLLHATAVCPLTRPAPR